MTRLLAPLALLAAAACGEAADPGPLDIALVGGSDEAAALLGANTMQGLVALDAEGEVEPALAQRWTVLEDGSYIFRLGDHRWDDGTPLTADQVARRLRRARREDTAIAPLLADIAAIDAITPYILELTLVRPRPDLLRLLALPELAVVRDGAGLGPLAAAAGYEPDGGRLLLAPRRAPPDPEAEDAEPSPPPGPAETIDIRTGRPALAVARYRIGEAALVLGGDWTTLPYARAIDPQQALVVDPAIGLFGLAFVEQAGFLAAAENRQLLSLAIDRERIAAALAQAEARAATAILPPDTAGLAAPVAPPWRNTDIALRRDFAREAVARWEAANDGPAAPLRIALPDAAGSALLFALVEADWRAIGIEAVRVPWDGDADLRLVDRIAPSDRPGWYLQFFRCAARFPCSEAYAEALDAFGEAQTPRVRAIRATEAARALEAAAPFIPLLRPIRWSLVRPGLAGFSANRFASHPLAPILAARD